MCQVLADLSASLTHIGSAIYNFGCETVHKRDLTTVRAPARPRPKQPEGDEGYMRKPATRHWQWPLRKLVTLFSVALIALLSVNVAFADFGQPNGITNEANKMHNLYLFVTVMGLIVFVLVEGALVFALFRFRKKSDDLPSQIHGNNLLEVVWTAIPMVIVVILFAFALRTLLEIENESDSEDLTVCVQGFQYQWQFEYRLNDLGAGRDAKATEAAKQVKGNPCEAEGNPADITVIGKAGTVNEPTLVIPVGERVEFRLRSTDVIHSFYIRDFLYKLDVIPGRDNGFTVTANQTGSFFGQCAELCGLDHSLMRFKVEVKSRADFDKWVAEQAVGSKATRQP